jgi:U4/U6 small nuclear ribonucleoprotein PRP31
VAAKLVAIAGGIKKLSEIPACNVQNLGKKGKMATGMSRISQGVHDGLIVTSKVIQDTPPVMRQRALRLLGGKVTLAARLDAFGSDDAPLGGVSNTADDGARGRELIEEVRAKIEKWQEAPAAAAIKALPAPLSRAKPRRGGRRHRKQREASAITDLGRQKKRAFFGKEELVDEYTGEGLGMIGQEGTGQLRVQAKEAKLAKRLSQKTQARLKKQAGVLGVGNKAALAGLGTVTSLASMSGTASSIAFTPAQGMHLVKTESAATRGTALHRASDTYFANNLAFNRVKQEAAAKKQLPPVPSFAAAAAADSGSHAPPDAKRQRLA